MPSRSQQEQFNLPDASQQPVAACLLLGQGWGGLGGSAWMETNA